jgi:transcriptional regulator with PAS, ATPase and Fis domain
VLESLNLSNADIEKKTIYDLVEEGYYSPSTIIRSISSKKQETAVIKVFQDRGDKSRYKLYFSSTKPILDKDGNLKYTITNTRDVGVIDLFNKELDENRKHKKKYKNYINAVNESDEIIAESEEMKKILKLCRQLGKNDSAILITGESGVGKDIVAQYIHKNSDRKGEQFIPINCGAIPDELVESELFGYKKGAFTGADPAGNMGVFEMANNGTLFLDEVGEIPFNVQSKLLRVLDTNELKKVGSSEYTKVNVRIIAATNRDLKQMVKEKKFREDLFYRLNVIPIEIPPLRERREDIIPLAEEFLNKINKKYFRNKYLSNFTKENLLKYQWPGNVRELRNIIERLTIMGDEDEINYNINCRTNKENPPEFLDDYEKIKIRIKNESSVSLRDAVQNFVQEYIKEALIKCGGNMTKTAEILGLHRTLLYKKLNK